MTEILAESRIRVKNQITLPKKVVELKNFSLGDFARFILCDNGEIRVDRSVTKGVNNNCGGGNDREKKHS